MFAHTLNDVTPGVAVTLRQHVHRRTPLFATGGLDPQSGVRGHDGLGPGSGRLRRDVWDGEVAVDADHQREARGRHFAHAGQPHPHRVRYGAVLRAVALHSRRATQKIVFHLETFGVFHLLHDSCVVNLCVHVVLFPLHVGGAAG